MASGPARNQNQMRMIFIVQSTRSPDFIDGRIEGFINTVEVSVYKYHRLFNIVKNLSTGFLKILTSVFELSCTKALSATHFIRINILQVLRILRLRFSSKYSFY